MRPRRGPNRGFQGREYRRISHTVELVRCPVRQAPSKSTTTRWGYVSFGGRTVSKSSVSNLGTFKKNTALLFSKEEGAGTLNGLVGNREKSLGRGGAPQLSFPGN